MSRAVTRVDSVPLFDPIIQAVQVVGFPIVIAILLIMMLWWVERNAVSYFTTKLDEMSQRQEEAITALTSSINAQTVQAAATHEALKTVMLFISSNMAQLVAHRETVEPLIKADAPKPTDPNVPPPGV